MVCAPTCPIDGGWTRPTGGQSGACSSLRVCACRHPMGICWRAPAGPPLDGRFPPAVTCAQPLLASTGFWPTWSFPDGPALPAPSCARPRRLCAHNAHHSRRHTGPSIYSICASMLAAISMGSRVPLFLSSSSSSFAVASTAGGPQTRFSSAFCVFENHLISLQIFRAHTTVCFGLKWRCAEIGSFCV